jgi:ribonuclease Z
LERWSEQFEKLTRLVPTDPTASHAFTRAVVDDVQRSKAAGHPPAFDHEVHRPAFAGPARERQWHPFPARDPFPPPVLDQDGLRITAIEVDHAPIAPAYAYRFDYTGRSVLLTGDLKFHAPLVASARGVDILVSEAIAVSMTRALGSGATAAGRDRTAAIVHDIEDYHITPAQAAQIANDAQAKLLVFYHLLPSPDGMLARRVSAQGLADVRRGDWTIADDGSLYTLPLGSADVRSGRVVE